MKVNVNDESSCFPLRFAGDECYPTCVVTLNMDLQDPVVLLNSTTADTLKHWMLPTTVQVRGQPNRLSLT